MDTITYKQYESIFIGGRCTEDDCVTPVPIPAQPEHIEADVTDASGQFVLRFDVIIDDAAQGLFTLTTDKLIPKGKYFSDVYFTVGGVRAASPTFALEIDFSPTKPKAILTQLRAA